MPVSISSNCGIVRPALLFQPHQHHQQPNPVLLTHRLKHLPSEGGTYGVFAYFTQFQYFSFMYVVLSLRNSRVLAPTLIVYMSWLEKVREKYGYI